MQAEAGQDIGNIIARKELERRASGGLFFWGIGNAPNRAIGTLAVNCEDIDVVFSLMKTRPAARDVAPAGIFTWWTYIDNRDVERALPPHVLVTSRMKTSAAIKSVHYALVCRSAKELRLEDSEAFDPSAYRNLSNAGRPVGNSQVTALVVRTRSESLLSGYRVNLRAKLAGGYWVKLGRPCILGDKARAALLSACTHAGEIDCADWIRVVSKIRCTTQS